MSLRNLCADSLKNIFNSQRIKYQLEKHNLSFLAGPKRCPLFDSHGKLYMKQACAAMIHSALVSQMMAMFFSGFCPRAAKPLPNAVTSLYTWSYDIQRYSPKITCRQTERVWKHFQSCHYIRLYNFLQINSSSYWFIIVTIHGESDRIQHFWRIFCQKLLLYNPHASSQAIKCTICHWLFVHGTNQLPSHSLFTVYKWHLYNNARSGLKNY